MTDDVASHVWSKVESALPTPSSAGESASAAASAASAVATSALSSSETYLHNQLASALSTTSDAKYYEESISPSSIRESLIGADPSNPASTSPLLRAMKWLLACMSKGRDVSDFYPHVVKLVGGTGLSLEVRKMVYMYLVRYADHDPTTRELSLLSVNAFQRGLADGEQLIRALALRVLTSVKVSDVVQIQILGVRKCCVDGSPYVRKCAANAIAKLYFRCPAPEQRSSLIDAAVKLLDDDTSTMVLTSALVAFSEICPDRLELLHGCYRKVCHLLTDMDEWGQIVVMDTLARYCRRFFKEPAGTKKGSAEVVDGERRVRRTATRGGGAGAAGGGGTTNGGAVGEALDELLPPPSSSPKKKHKSKGRGGKSGGGAGGATPGGARAKRRVVRKAFYSDEEDESSEEEIYPDARSSLAGSMRQRDVMGFGGGGGRRGGGTASNGPGNRSEDFGGGGPGSTTVRGGKDDDEDEDLDDDHRLLLNSSLPLLKSRNSGVVLAVCSLHYYCNVASVKIRSALGKALVRIHRDRREIQYVVLTSIRELASDCPSAFSPYLDDFFVKAMDPSFTRRTKLSILTSLALDPQSISAVLKELRTYVRHDDASFAAESVRSVGRVSELARIVYDRRGKRTGTERESRADADRIALDCLAGLTTLSEASRKAEVVGECASVMGRMLLQLSDGEEEAEDRNGARAAAVRRLVLLLVRTLTEGDRKEEEDREEERGGEGGGIRERLESVAVALDPSATAATLWTVGEALTTTTTRRRSASSSDAFAHPRDAARARSEILRLLCRSFPSLGPAAKLQAVHFASKVVLSSSAADGVDDDNDGERRRRPSSSKKKARGGASGGGPDDVAMAEFVLSMGRSDLDRDVRDRSRFESHLLLAASAGLSHDVETLGPSPPGRRRMTAEDARGALLRSKPPPSSLPLDDDDGGDEGERKTKFRFGTLSGLVGHRAGGGGAYLPLPPWASEDSPSSLREPPSPKSKEAKEDDWKVKKTKKSPSSFYDSDDEDDDGEASSSTESESGEDESSSSSSESESESEESESSSEEETSSEEEEDEEEEESDSDESSDATPPSPPRARARPVAASGPSMNGGGAAAARSTSEDVDSSSEESDASSSSSEEEEESSDDDDDAGGGARPAPAVGALLPVGPTSSAAAAAATATTEPTPATKRAERQASSASSLADGLEGLVMPPPIADGGRGSSEPERGDAADEERDSGAWDRWVRPELGGGLEATARYLRGPARDCAARSMKLDPANGAVVCLRVRLENKRTDAGTLRRIRIVQRTSGSAGGGNAITPRRTVLPLEISALKKRQSTTVSVGLLFPTLSDRDGALTTKLEIKSDRGSNAVEVRVPLGELLGEREMTGGDFEKNMERWKGIHQRVSSKFRLEEGGGGGSSAEDSREGLPLRIMKHCNLTPVGGSLTWTKELSSSSTAASALRLAGALPASNESVCVAIRCDPKTGEGTIVVCSESNAIAANGLLDSLKRAVLPSAGPN